ncbi:hypothetical protein EDD86DRAFT_200669 [Gorgonomyces haynaldii]|nr:hypothetical protein EDD86DRAFT_200669 [Gorgonomyces haynaldii]
MTLNSPLPASLEEECVKCARIIDAFAKPEDAKFRELVSKVDTVNNAVPKDVIKNAKGIAIMTVVKAGLIWTGRAGSGLVVSRLETGEWSAPSAIYTVGGGLGWQVGAELTDYVIILNTKEAVDAFFAANVTLGGNLSVAAGPYGRSGEVAAELTKMASIFTYSNSQGLFAGVSLEGSVILERSDANEKFYKEKVAAKEILSGFVARPAAADVLYAALAKYK